YPDTARPALAHRAGTRLFLPDPPATGPFLAHLCGGDSRHRLGLRGSGTPACAHRCESGLSHCLLLRCTLGELDRRDSQWARPTPRSFSGTRHPCAAGARLLAAYASRKATCAGQVASTATV